MDGTDKDLRRLRQELDIARSEILRLEHQGCMERSVLNSVFAATRDFLAFKDLNMVYRKVNPAFADYLGKSSDEIVGMTDESLFPPDIAGFSASIDARVMETLEPEAAEWKIAGTAGPLWLHVSISPVLDVEGKIAGVLCSARNITARKKAEVELQSFFDLVPDLVCVASIDGSFRKLNEAWHKTLGYSEKELLEVSYYDLIHPDDRELTKREINSQVEGHKTLNFINRYRAKDGSYRWLEWSASSAVGDQLYAVARDITGRILSEKQTRLWADAFNYCSHGIAIGQPTTNRIVTCNNAFAGMLGRAIRDVEGARILNLSAPEDHSHVIESIRQSDVEGCVSFQTRMQRNDGFIFPVQIDMVSVRDKQGMLLYRIVTMQDITERVRSEAELRDSETRFRSVVESAPEAIFIQTGRFFAYLNPAAIALFGASSEDQLLGHQILERVHPDDHQMVSERIRQINEEHLDVPLKETRYLHCDGTAFDVDAMAVPFVYNGQQGALVFARDISKRKKAEVEHAKLEQQLFQSQKMDSIGRLAGGVAHDLNNMLTPIIGYSEMLLDQFSRDDKRLSSIEGINHAGLRSRDLVHQLLAFSRGQSLIVKVLDLNSVLRGFEQLLRRTIRENITIRYTLFPDTLAIKGDIGQVEQIIMNLAVNAQDSMPDGGVINITTSMTRVETMESPAYDDLREGLYVTLSISDSGSGMDADTVTHIFEPFFTTKEKGRGTGLGLATVYGIVRQHEGNITVTSEPGKGSTFTVNFPLDSAMPAVSTQSSAPEQAFSDHGSNIILIVEDNDMVRKFVVQALLLEHYQVLDASSGEAAIRLLHEKGLSPDLLLTDVVMQGFSGRELFDLLRRKFPELKVLYMSGYMQNVISQHGVDEDDSSFIQKPFSIEALSTRVRELLYDDRN
jgi:PAS domain S-box-containing protein